jgi:uncharacterized RDD family membrane protein YckC
MSAMAAPPPERSVGRQGNYAGAVSRAVAFGADVGASWGLYTLGVAALSLFVQLITGHSFRLSTHQLAASIVLGVWEFIYFAGQWALGGQTIGMAVFGLRVVTTEGAPISVKQAVIRAATLPLSIAAFGLGFLGILTNRQRKAWHDHFAGTVVIYDWDARAARLRWLAKRERMGSATAAAAVAGATAAAQAPGATESSPDPPGAPRSKAAHAASGAPGTAPAMAGPSEPALPEPTEGTSPTA